MSVETPSVADVRLIIETSLSDAQITAIIADAALVVERCVSTLDIARQAAIVKYVTAHMISLQGGTTGALLSAKLGDAQDNYAALPLGQQLAGTTYGQSALNLDPNGCLPYIGKRRARLRNL